MKINLINFKRVLFVVFLVAFASGCSASIPTQNNNSTILVEAEQFTDCGGWKVDTQFIHIMGSPYLLAHGLGKPVENAKTQVSIPQNAAYHVWVRTKDWVPGDWDAPGRFKVVVNGQELETVFGTEAGWNWQKGDRVDLTKGTAELELKDLTGFDGRCDAVLLTTDPTYVPDNSSEPMNPWRRELLGIKMVQPEKEYDLVVVGGGLAGMGSAISAARMGLSVALIQNRSVLGGNGSTEIRVSPRGNYPDWLYPLGDLVKEYSPRISFSADTDDDKLNRLREQKVRDEKNIDLFLNHHAYQASAKDNKIDAVYALAVKEKVVRVFKGRWVVDATGHGVIGLWAGAVYHMEKKERMGMSNMWRWKNTKRPVKFPDTPWALQLTQDGFPYPQKKNKNEGGWFWESGFNKHPLDDLEAIRDHNFRAVFGAWNAIKNNGAYAHSDKTGRMHSRAELDWVAYIGGPRETLQILGDVILSKEDITSGRKFDDACVISTWGLDLHYAHPLYEVHTPDNPFISRAHIGGRIDDSKGDLATDPKHIVHPKEGHGFDRKKGYAIPYRCLYSRNIDNLFAPGRNMSVTHEALGTVRVMQTLGMCGVAVGRAAYVCKKYDTTPRGAYQNHLAELKKVWSLPANHREYIHGNDRSDMKKPNIIVILADDMGFSDLGCTGAEIQTPNLDKLASDGLLFTNCYNTSRCCPTRAALLTGQYQWDAGMGDMTTTESDFPEYQKEINDNNMTIAESLQQVGYQTFMAGKWHLGDRREAWPDRRGFEQFYASPFGGGIYFYPFHIDRPIYHNGVEVIPDENWYSTDAFTDETVDYIRHRPSKEKPFLIYLAYVAPHVPLQAKKEDIDKYRDVYKVGYNKIRNARYEKQKRLGLFSGGMKASDQDVPHWKTVKNKDQEALKMAVYAAQIDCMDQNIGRIVSVLKEEGILENTVIMFMSDNGACQSGLNKTPDAEIGTRDSYAGYGKWYNVSNTPYRKRKAQEHEGGIITPLIMHWPNGIDMPGKKISDPVHVMDVMPVCLELAGATYPDNFLSRKLDPLDGISFMPLIDGTGKHPERTLFWEHEGNRAVRQGDWKLVALHKENWELYDLNKDPFEQNDLADKYPEKASQLRKLYGKWANDHGVRPWPLKKN